jgi:hypothetical protein
MYSLWSSWFGRDWMFVYVTRLSEETICNNELTSAIASDYRSGRIGIH